VVFLPERPEKKTGEYFDEEVSKGDAGSAVGAPAAQPKPGEDGEIAVPGDWRFAGWAEGAARFAHREVAREPVDADVEKRTHDCAEDEGK